ncbi:MAG: hypothetical protein Fur006_09530 [Coleofasciculaceae cyanobacterium]
MNAKEASHKTELNCDEGLSDLMEELSDEEAGACVGGVDLHLETEPVDKVINTIEPASFGVKIPNLFEFGYDSFFSARARGFRG